MSKKPFSFLASSKSTESLSSPWRADFRDVSRLPDLKVVRTDFLINYGLLALAVLLASYAGFVEYGNWSLNKEIEACESEMNSRRVQDSKCLRDSGQFSANMSVVDAFVKFKTRSVGCAEILAELGKFRPEGLRVSGVLVDSAHVDLKTKKERVRVMLSGSKSGVTPANIYEVDAAYKRFIGLPLWRRDKALVMTPAPLGIQTNDKTIDFTFELFLDK